MFKTQQVLVRLMNIWRAGCCGWLAGVLATLLQVVYVSVYGILLEEEADDNQKDLSARCMQGQHCPNRRARMQTGWV